MKKILLSLFILFTGIPLLQAQGLEFRLRGGANLQRTIGSDAESEFSLYSHAGAMAGLRISTIGIYAEVLYSAHEEANGGGAINYVVPSALARFYTYKFLYAEAGLSYYLLAEDVPDGFNSNPDKEAGFYAGLGATTRRLELGMRASMKPFKTVQLTASFRF